MDRAELALSTSLQVLGQMQASISHNLANINSTAFKRRVGTIHDLESALQNAQTSGTSTTIPAYREMADASQGDFKTTDDSSNLALIGEGYLRVRDGKGKEFYTRDGSFARSASGTLTTRSGYAILSQTGEAIELGGAGAVKVTAQGVLVNDEDGEELGRIGLWKFEDRRGLTPRGSSLFVAEKSAGAPQLDSDTEVRQGGLERSNVDGVSELVAMIAVQRHHSAVARALTTVEGMNDQLLNLARG